MQQFLKSPPGVARTKIIASEFFAELFVTMNHADSTLYLFLRREALSPFTDLLKAAVLFVIFKPIGLPLLSDTSKTQKGRIIEEPLTIAKDRPGFKSPDS